MDYKETYFLVINEIIFRFLISLEVYDELDICLMYGITIYLYGFIDNDAYIKILKGFKPPKAKSIKPRSVYSIKLQ